MTYTATEIEEYLRRFFRFIENSPTSWHAGRTLLEGFVAAGFQVIDEADSFKLATGGSYVISRDDSMVAAFRLGRRPPWEAGARVAAAHTDSPALKLKLRSGRRENDMLTAVTQVYGGPIISSWIDRNLRVAGRVTWRNGPNLTTTLVDTTGPVAVVPNAAIHLNREINDTFSYNRQTQLKAMVAVPHESLLALAAALVRSVTEDDAVSADVILDAELFLADGEGPVRLGKDGSLLTASRLDNLASCHAIAEALCSASIPVERGAGTTAAATKGIPDATGLALFFDHEEVGSTTQVGARSAALRTLIERIVVALGGTGDAVFQTLARSFLISCDVTHGLHPAYAEKYDPDYAPLLNGGPAIKYNGAMAYTSTAPTASLFAAVCEDAGVPVQRFLNRSDMRSGSTIGPSLSALGEIPSVDIGVPIFAMHSLRETAGVEDNLSMVRALTRYFEPK